MALAQIAYTPWGVLVAMTFIGLPFTVRSLQPVMAELGADLEEAAVTLGATRLQTSLAKIVILALLPASSSLPARRWGLPVASANMAR